MRCFFSVKKITFKTELYFFEEKKNQMENNVFKWN